MLFFTRCFLCIGTIVVLAEGIDLTGVVTPARSVTGSIAKTAADRVQAYCRGSPARCLAMATAALQARQDLDRVTLPGATGGHRGVVRHAGARPLPPFADEDLSLRRGSPK